MREREIEARLVAAVAAAGGRAYKFVSPGRSGVPDRLVAMPNGRVAFVEVKAPGAKPRPLQARELAFLARLGCEVYVLDHPTGVGALVRSLTARRGNG